MMKKPDTIALTLLMLATLPATAKLPQKQVLTLKAAKRIAAATEAEAQRGGGDPKVHLPALASYCIARAPVSSPPPCAGRSGPHASVRTVGSGDQHQNAMLMIRLARLKSVCASSPKKQPLRLALTPKNGHA